MYSCPHCGKDTFAFWGKATASAVRPSQCANCGAQVALRTWPLLPLAILASLVCIAITLVLLRWRVLGWAGFLIAIIPLVISYLILVHFTPLTLATERAKRITRALQWLAWSGLAVYFIWQFAHVHVP